MNRYRRERLAYARRELLYAARQIEWALERDDREAAMRCAIAADYAYRARDILRRADRALRQTASEERNDT